MWSVEQSELPGGRGQHFAVRHDDGDMTCGEVLEAWRADAEFGAWFNATLAGSSYSAFRWETPAVTASSLHRPFEFVLLNAPSLERPADPSAFAEHFTKANSAVVTFDNLGRNATLVVPTEQGKQTAYGHLAAFVRNAPAPQQIALWKAVGEAMAKRISTRPVWLSTAGAGVPWLHVRLDDQPKYYGYRPYRQTQ